MCVHEAYATSIVVTTSRLLLSVENDEDGGHRSTPGKVGLKFDGKNAENFLERSSKLRVSLSLYNKSIFEIIQGSKRPSYLDNEQVTVREGWVDADHNLFSILYSTTFGPALSVVRRFEAKTR